MRERVERRQKAFFSPSLLRTRGSFSDGIGRMGKKRGGACRPAPRSPPNSFLPLFLSPGHKQRLLLAARGSLKERGEERERGERLKYAGGIFEYLAMGRGGRLGVPDSAEKKWEQLGKPVLDFVVGMRGRKKKGQARSQPLSPILLPFLSIQAP